MWSGTFLGLSLKPPKPLSNSYRTLLKEPFKPCSTLHVVTLMELHLRGSGAAAVTVAVGGVVRSSSRRRSISGVSLGGWAAVYPNFL